MAIIGPYAIRRRRRRRRYGKRRGRVATVRQVKSLISRAEETKKHILNMSDFLPGARRCYMVNPFAQIFKGGADNQRIGSKMQKIRLNMSFSWTYTGTDVTGSTRLGTGAPLRVMVVRTPRRLGLGTSNAWVQCTTLAPSATSDLPFLVNNVQTVNSLTYPSDVKVIKQFWLHSTQPNTNLMFGDTVFKQVSVSIPTFTADDSITAYTIGRDYNYYVVITSSGGPGLPDNSDIGEVQSHFTLTWKDA